MTGFWYAERRGRGAPKRHGRTGVVGDSDFAAAGSGRNPGDVWSIPTAGFPEAHFAVMPPTIAERCILAGCRPGGVVLDPFGGSGTTGMMALKHGRRFVGIDLSTRYLELALRTRLAQTTLLDPASKPRDETPPGPRADCDETPNGSGSVAVCSGPVAVATAGRPRTYCSRSCRQSAYRARSAAGRTATAAS